MIQYSTNVCTAYVSHGVYQSSDRLLTPSFASGACNPSWFISTDPSASVPTAVTKGCCAEEGVGRIVQGSGFVYSAMIVLCLSSMCVSALDQAQINAARTDLWGFCWRVVAGALVAVVGVATR